MQCGQGKPFTVTSTNSKMGSAAIRSYQAGGVVTGANPNIDDDTRARAMKFVAENATPAKQRVVSKKELEASGLSLRDFLNKERGLTRRKDAEDGGRAKVERQSPGMNPSEYIRSGKAMVDKQDREAELDKLNRSYGSRNRD